MPDMMDRMMDRSVWDATVVLLWLVVLAVAVAVVVLAYKVMVGPGRGSGAGSDDGLRIVDERYARGEIDREEYEDRRRSLQVGRR